MPFQRAAIRLSLIALAGLWQAACGGSVDDLAPAAASQPAAAAAEPAVVAPPPPDFRVDNVVLITVDTLRADALGFMGNTAAATPALDRLAAAGRVYDDAHAHNVVTLPSHANMLTGLYPYQHGVRDNSGFVLPASIPTAATLLAGAGFATGAVVGAFPLDSRYGLDRGFELYDDEVPRGSRATEIVPAERRGDEVVRRATEWWRRHDGERRFLWLHLFDPHAPYEPPPELAFKFQGRRYDGEVAAVDGYLEPLLDPFLAGDEASTLVVFTSDHGEALGDHGELTHGLFAYEATLEVPLVLWAPGLPAGRPPTPARHVDLLPTMLDAAGVAVPEGLAGRSLLAPEEAETPPVACYFESLTPTLDRGWAPLTGIIVGDLKLISLPLPELYDLAADPGETDNLYASRRDRARELAARLPVEASWPPQRAAADESERAALRSLGYLGGAAAGKSTWSAADDPKRLVHLDRKMHEVVDLYQQRRLDRAAQLAREVIAERADMGIAHYYLAQVLLESERRAEALEVMRAARRDGVASPALLRQLGLSLAEAGRFEEALAVLRPRSESSDPDVLNALGLVLSEAGRLDEARAVLERALAADTGNPVAHQSLALVALERGDFASARDAARAALALNPGLGLAWNYLGTALYNLGQKREALTALVNAIDHEPDNYDALYNTAVVAMEIGDTQRARELLRAFIARAPAARYGPDIERARGWLAGLGG